MNTKIYVLVKTVAVKVMWGLPQIVERAYFCLELVFWNIVIQQSLNRQVKLTLENILTFLWAKNLTTINN